MTKHTDPSAELRIILGNVFQLGVYSATGVIDRDEVVQDAYEAIWTALLPQAPDDGLQEALVEDAAKWHALMSCERIRIMGCTENMSHIGVEFWARHRAKHPSKDYPQDRCRQKLEEFVAALSKSSSVQGGEDG